VHLGRSPSAYSRLCAVDYGGLEAGDTLEIYKGNDIKGVIIITVFHNGHYICSGSVKKNKDASAELDDSPIVVNILTKLILALFE